MHLFHSPYVTPHPQEVLPYKSLHVLGIEHREFLRALLLRWQLRHLLDQLHLIYLREKLTRLQTKSYNYISVVRESNAFPPAADTDVVSELATHLVIDVLRSYQYNVSKHPASLLKKNTMNIARQWKFSYQL